LDAVRLFIEGGLFEPEATPWLLLIPISPQPQLRTAESVAEPDEFVAVTVRV